MTVKYVLPNEPTPRCASGSVSFFVFGCLHFVFAKRAHDALHVRQCQYYLILVSVFFFLAVRARAALRVRQRCSLASVSICTFVLVKQVNGAPARPGVRASAS